MSNITNLNRIRKAKARTEKRAKADENAIRFGRSKAQKETDAKTADKARRDLDGHQRE